MKNLAFILPISLLLACARDEPGDPPSSSELGDSATDPDTDVGTDDGGSDGGADDDDTEAPDTEDTGDDDTAAVKTPEDDFPLVLGQRQPCDDPLERPAWREVGESWGFAGVDPSGKKHGEGGAIALDDFDDDGDVDVMIGWTEDTTVLYLRDGDAWIPRELEGINRVVTINLADVDGDGRRDVLLGRHGTAAIYRVTGDAELTALPMPEWDLNTHVKEYAPADIDRDGDVDLYALVRGGGADISQKQDSILWNNGHGIFQVDHEAIPEVARYRHGFDSTWFDWDLDGDMDMYVANDLGNDYGPDALLENRDGELVDASEACGCEVTHTGMSVDYADFNRDGYPDLYVSDAHVNVMLQSIGGGVYVDSALSLGATLADQSVYMTWGAIYSDLDNDGHQDILAARGDYADAEPADYSTPTALAFDGVTYTDVSAELGLGAEEFRGIFRAVIAVDLNGDGLVDPIYTQVIERPLVFLSEGCTAENWLAIDGPDGARVEVVAGGEVFVDWISTQSGLAASHLPLLHMGLGAHERVDSITMYTPDGRVHVRDQPFEARRQVRLRP